MSSSVHNFSRFFLRDLFRNLSCIFFFKLLKKFFQKFLGIQEVLKKFLQVLYQTSRNSRNSSRENLRKYYRVYVQKSCKKISNNFFWESPKVFTRSFSRDFFSEIFFRDFLRNSLHRFFKEFSYFFCTIFGRTTEKKSLKGYL